jgi:hypothetical protein
MARLLLRLSRSVVLDRETADLAFNRDPNRRAFGRAGGAG